jgi:hypothetical protein
MRGAQTIDAIKEIITAKALFVVVAAIALGPFIAICLAIRGY